MTTPVEPTTPSAPTGTGRFFSEEELHAEIERVRKEEKDKLYPVISKTDARSQAMETELKELRAFQKKQEKTEAERLAAIEAERQKAADAELSAKDLIAKRDAEYQARIDALQQDTLQREALLRKELEYMQLQNYIQRRVAEEQDNIAPELLDFIDGNDEAQVEASIDRVKAKTQQIVENMRSAGVRKRAAMPGVAPAAGTNGITPLDGQGDRQLTADDIHGMDMAQFAALRQKIGMDRNGGQGLFD